MSYYKYVARSIKPIVTSICVLCTTLSIPTITHAQQAPQQAISTANQNSSQDTKDILSYIMNLEGQSLSGVYIGTDGSPQDIVDFNALGEETGQYPAIMGADYCQGWNTAEDPTTLVSWDILQPALTEHWEAGGLVSICHHLYDPNNTNGGGYNNRPSNFSDLLDHDSDMYKAYIAQMDKVAEGLSVLQDDGVVVLYRPLHEFTHNGFWWSGQDSETFVAVWRELFDYFTEQKELNNLLWVWNPMDEAPSLDKYPGDNYVDIVSFDTYSAFPESKNSIVTGYNAITTSIPNKPFIVAELGPGSTSVDFDYQRWAVTLKQKIPKAKAFIAWKGANSPYHNRNADLFMNDPWFINRGQLTVRGGTSLNAVSNGGFETSNVNNWIVNDSNVIDTGHFDGSYGINCTTSGGGFYQTITGLNPETTYTLTAALKLSSGTENAQLYVKDYGAAQITKAIKGVTYSSYDITFTTGVSQTSCTIGVSFTEGIGGVYGDNFVVSKGIPCVIEETPIEIKNSGFETGNKSNWWMSNTVTFVTQGQHSGNYAVVCTAGGLEQTVAGLQPNTTYAVSCYSKSTTGTEQIALYVKNYNGSAPQMNTQIGSIVTGEYNKNTVLFRTGDTAGTVNIGVWFNGGTGAVYLDDFNIEIDKTAPVGTLKSPTGTNVSTSIKGFIELGFIESITAISDKTVTITGGGNTYTASATSGTITGSGNSYNVTIPFSAFGITQKLTTNTLYTVIAEAGAFVDHVNLPSAVISGTFTTANVDPEVESELREAIENANKILGNSNATAAQIVNAISDLAKSAKSFQQKQQK